MNIHIRQADLQSFKISFRRHFRLLATLVLLSGIVLPAWSTQTVELSGTVTSGDQGAEGIEVSVEPLNKRFRSILQAHSDERMFAPLETTTTDKTGKFVLKTAHRSSFNVVVTVPNGSKLTYPIYPVLENSIELPALSLPQLKEIQVKVEDPANRKVPGAYVRLESRLDGGWQYGRSMATTDAEGVASLNIPVQGARLAAWHPRLRSTDLEKVQGNEVTIQLGKGFRRTIHLQSKNTPMDLQGSILSLGKWPIGIEDPSIPIVVAVSKEPMTLTLATRGGYVFTQQIQAVPTPEEQRFDWDFPPIMAFRGHIVDSRTGNPIRDAATWVQGMPETIRYTNSKGGFLLSSPLEPFAIEIAASGYQSHTLELKGTEAESKHKRRILSLEATRVLNGRVVDPDKKPIEGARIRPIDTTGRWTQPEGLTDSNGSFKIGPVGAKGVLVEKDGWATTISDLNQSSVPVRMSRGASIRGDVRDSSTREIIESAEVGLWLLHEQDQRWTLDPLQAVRVDDNGNFTFAGLPEGIYELEVRAKGYLSKKHPVKVTSKDEKKEVRVDSLLLEEGEDGPQL